MNLFLTILIGGFIGWVTNYLAVIMLFRPHRAVSFCSFKIQGVFPKRQSEIAAKLGHIVSRELISSDEIKNVISTLAAEPRVLEILDGQIDKALQEKIPLLGPLFSMAFNSDAIGKIKNVFAADLQQIIVGLADDLGGELEKKLDVQEIVRAKIEAFSSQRLEELMMEIMRREFRFIEFIGAVLGMLIAAAQVALLRFI